MKAPIFLYGRHIPTGTKLSGYPSLKISSEEAIEGNHNNFKSQTSEDIEKSLMQKTSLS
jgi:hypothetical protein